ncbi:NADH-quinone oxidoreductase subunit C [Streptomyces sp. NPDC015501]|uniref:NADH-quinone oxidoreductase subunit C n=1 Tax=unclassified Streptomyces TaxID=2593676 RepID=UPI0011A01DB5|nr:NADH dehydrogenase [Streptomyces griseus subsp. griseus]
MSDRDRRTASASDAAEAYDRLPDAVVGLFGDGSAAESAYDLLTVDVPAAAWLTALRTARDELGCSYFDWLSAVDEPGVGFRVCAHVAALGTGRVRRLMVRTTVPHDAAVLPSAVDVYAGAAWHERETHEMFGVAFDGHPHLVPLLLPEGFEGHPLRKDFVLAARVAKAWPGAKEPGEPADGHTGPKRRAMLPPGVPDPNEWGPLKGQLPPAAARPARAARPAADRPPRRTRSASEGSAAQRPATTGAETRTDPDTDARTAPGAGAPAPTGATTRTETGAETPAISEATPQTPETASPTPEVPPAARPRRSRSAAEGSASQNRGPDASTPPPAARPRRSRSAADGSASQQPTGGPAPGAPGGEPSPASGAPDRAPRPPRRVRSTDAPWHDARPAFDEPAPQRPEPEDRRAGQPSPGRPEPEHREPERSEPEHREPESGAPRQPSSGPPAPQHPDPHHPDPEQRAPEQRAPERSDPDHPAGGDPE